MVILHALCNIIGNSLPRILIKVSYSRYYLNRPLNPIEFPPIAAIVRLHRMKLNKYAAESYVDFDFACSCCIDLA